jgi:hypothetical protein
MTETRSVFASLDNPEETNFPTYLSGLDAVPGSGFLEDIPKPTIRDEESVDIKSRRKRIVRMAQDDPEGFNFLCDEVEEVLHRAFEDLRLVDCNSPTVNTLLAKCQQTERIFNLIRGLGQKE